MAESEEPLLGFDHALVVAEHVYNSANPALLIGNGFSQAFSEKFGYKALREKAPLTSLTPGVTKDDLFDHAGTNDFETVIRTLEHAAELHDLYDKNGTLRTRLREDAELVKKGLVDALVAIHPSSAAEIKPTKYAPARSFLSNFSVVFTLNYDLLLYWAINQQASLSTTTPRDDGFRLRNNVLTWIDPGLAAQEVFFLPAQCTSMPKTPRPTSWPAAVVTSSSRYRRTSRVGGIRWSSPRVAVRTSRHELR